MDPDSMVVPPEQASTHDHSAPSATERVRGPAANAAGNAGSDARGRRGSTGRARPPRSRSRETPPKAADAACDVLDPRGAAAIVRLGYPDQFNRVRWSLEEPFDLASGQAIPLPPELDLALLTTSQERALDRRDAEAAAQYRLRKAERIAYARAHWMRVPAWGGRQPPGGEYRYSRARCEQWALRTLGEVPAG